MRRTFWIGTEFDGISKLISFEKNEFLKVKNESNHFRSANAILQDKNSDLWLSSDNGLVQFKNQKVFNSFSLEDGLQNKEFNINAALLASNGVMYFGGTEGFNYFKPNEISVQYCNS